MILCGFGAAADVVVLTVPYSAHVPTLESVKDQLQGKIFVDVSVPLDPDNARRVIMPAAGSASQEAQEILGENVSVVCALQNTSAHLLRDVKAGIDCDVLVCGAPKEARAAVIDRSRAEDPGVAAFRRTIRPVAWVASWLGFGETLRARLVVSGDVPGEEQ